MWELFWFCTFSIKQRKDLLFNFGFSRHSITLYGHLCNHCLDIRLVVICTNCTVTLIMVIRDSDSMQIQMHISTSINYSMVAWWCHYLKHNENNNTSFWVEAQLAQQEYNGEWHEDLLAPDIPKLLLAGQERA